MSDLWKIGVVFGLCGIVAGAASMTVIHPAPGVVLIGLGSFLLGMMAMAYKLRRMVRL